MKPALLLLTCSDKKEASMIANVLLEQKLVACVKQLSVNSQYWWQSKIHSGKEVLLMLETLNKRFDTIEEVVKKLHSYKQPVLLQIPITKFSAGVEQWLRKSTK